MGVVPLIVKGGVPAELVWGDTQLLCQLWSKGGEVILPSLGIVEACVGGILTAQGDDGEPHISLVRPNLPHHLGQVDHLTTAVEETVGGQLFHPWAVGDVVYIVFLPTHLIQVVLRGGGNKVRGCLHRGGLEVVLVLEEGFGVGEIF